MARPMWTGSLSFGLVNVGVGLYSATEDRTVSFHQLEHNTHKRVRNKRVAEGTDREVSYSDIVKGYPTSGGEHVIVTQEELEEAEPQTTRTITIEDFVAVEEIEPIYFQRAYYLGPRGDGNEHPYALLREAMNRTGLAGVAKLVMRNKEHLVIIRATEDVLVLSTMFFADEVRAPATAVETLPGEHQLPKREVETAVSLIEQLTTHWDPGRYRDTYRERVLTLIEQKASGEEPSVEPAEEPTGNVVDLVSALEESIERAKSGRAGGQSGRKRTQGGKRARSGSRDLGSLTKKQLYERAGDLGISGRSKMSREELREAVQEAS